MAPNAGMNGGQLSLLNAEVSLAQFEVMLTLGGISRDVTKMRKAFLYADGPTAQWMLNAGIQLGRVKFDDFRELFIKKSIEERLEVVGTTDPQTRLESLSRYVSRVMNRSKSYGCTVNDCVQSLLSNVSKKFEDELRMRIGFPTKFRHIEMVLDHIKRDEIARISKAKKLHAEENAKRRIEQSRRYKEVQSKNAQMNALITERKTNEVKKEKIKIEGKEYEAILDTGATENFIDEKIVRELGKDIQEIPKVQIKNIFGQEVIETNKKISVLAEKKREKQVIDMLVIETPNQDKVVLGNPTLAHFLESLEKKTQMLKDFPKVFDDCPSEGIKGAMCSIPTFENKKVNIRSKRIPQHLVEPARKAIEKYLKAGYLRESHSSWCNPMKPVEKPGSEIARITCNYMCLNKIAEDDHYSIPRIQDIIESTRGMRCFTVIDLSDGYFQIPLEEKDWHKTAFLLQNRLYEWTRMPQGYKNSPAVFQRTMDAILYKHIGPNCKVYMDDILICASTPEEHDKILRIVLNTMSEHGVKLNPTKIQYRQTKINLLGAVVDGITQSPINEMREKALRFKTPENKKEIEKFLGFVNAYRKYIRDAATKMAPLYNRIASKTPFVWTEELENTFNSLKEDLYKNVRLYIPNFEKEFYLSTDASNVGLGFILEQINDDGSEILTVDWGSRVMNKTEQRYSITEKELLAIVEGVKHYDYYLRGRKFTVITDHKALEALNMKGELGSPRLERLREKLQEYNFTVKYIEGEKNVKADLLSRQHKEKVEQSSQIVEKETLSIIKKKRPVLDDDQLMERLRPKLEQVGKKYYWKTKSGGLKEVPQPKERLGILKMVHEEQTAHAGISGMRFALAENHYWPYMRRDIESWVKSCEGCARNKQKTKGGEEMILADSPLEILGMDIMTLAHGRYILVAVDYYSRKMQIKVMPNKETATVTRSTEEIFTEIGTPKTLITDEGCEFTSNIFKQLCNKEGIVHHTASPDKHQSNGRVERAIRKLWQIIRKKSVKEEITDEKLPRLVEQVNNTLCRAVGTTPNKAWTDGCLRPRKYEREFKKLHREKFAVKDEVYVAELESKNESKLGNRFGKLGIVLKILPNDSYLIWCNNKIVKRNHASLVLKKI